ncbi:hypothetical protein GCM10022280_12720 [Sphingomonas swuensis]|uniref:Uncharacterized protein n=1 Tax=Sphingomonas swuensis TaxID=977800 RepID=A0ABP7SRA7_9SPHN
MRTTPVQGWSKQMPYAPDYRGTKSAQDTRHEAAIKRLVESDSRMCRNGFKRVVRDLWDELGGDPDEMETLSFLPDAFLVDRERRELLLYEVEDTSALKPAKKALYGAFWFAWDSEDLHDWLPRLFVCSTTGRVSYEVPLSALYYDWIDEIVRADNAKQEASV